MRETNDYSHQNSGTNSDIKIVPHGYFYSKKWTLSQITNAQIDFHNVILEFDSKSFWNLQVKRDNTNVAMDLIPRDSKIERERDFRNTLENAAS